MDVGWKRRDPKENDVRYDKNSLWSVTDTALQYSLTSLVNELALTISKTQFFMVPKDENTSVKGGRRRSKIARNLFQFVRTSSWVHSKLQWCIDSMGMPRASTIKKRTKNSQRWPKECLHRILIFKQQTEDIIQDVSTAHLVWPYHTSWRVI